MKESRVDRMTRRDVARAMAAALSTACLPACAVHSQTAPASRDAIPASKQNTGFDPDPTPVFLRTPEERFANLEAYPFAPHYQYWQGLRLHYVDEGTGAPIVMLHGQPTYSYLYRNFIPPLVAAGFRCIAPDYIGFGKSDKVVDDNWYRIARHAAAIRALLVDGLNLSNVTLVVHDWGGPIGLPLATELPGRFARLFIFNTWLHHEGFDFSGMKRYRDTAITFAPYTGDIPVMGGTPAYQAPFPDPRYKAGPRRFPFSHPYAEPELGNKVVQEATFEALKSWKKPAHVIFSDSDRVFTANWGRSWSQIIPGATFDTVPGLHYPQEVSPRPMVDLMLRYLRG